MVHRKRDDLSRIAAAQTDESPSGEQPIPTTMKQARTWISRTALAVFASAVFGQTAMAAPGTTVNVNLALTGALDEMDGKPFISSSFQQAPAPYPGTRWNDVVRELVIASNTEPGSSVTRTDLLDSTGGATTIGFTTASTTTPFDFDGPYTFSDHPDTTLLNGGDRRVWNSGSGNLLHNRLTVTGLDDAKVYDLFIASSQTPLVKCSWQIGPSGTPKEIRNSAVTRDSQTWRPGDNWVVFHDVPTNGSGSIDVRGLGQAGSNGGAFSGLTLNGFQIVEATGWQSPDTSIYDFGTPAVAGTSSVVSANGTGDSIAWTVLFAANLSTLAPTFSLADGATCSPPSGSTQNFSLGPVNYTVTAEDGTQRIYAVSTVLGPPSEANEMLSIGTADPFAMSEILGTDVTFYLPPGTPLNPVTPIITLSPFATVSPASGVARNFTAPVNYTVTAQDGVSTAIYTVTAVVLDGLEIPENQTYTINGGNVTVEGQLTTWNELGPLTMQNGATLWSQPPQNNVVLNRAGLILAGNGGTYNFRFNDNDTHFKLTGPIKSIGTGAQTLAIYTGDIGNGDRESVTFYSGIPDVGDASPMSVQARFQTQTGSTSFVNLPGNNTFTGPLTLLKGNAVNDGFLTIGGVRTNTETIPGTGRLGGGDYPGAITLDVNTTFNYLSSAAQTLSGVISGPGKVVVGGGGTVTLSGLNTYTANTTVSAGSTLILADNGGMTFAITDSSATKITGAGTATLDGDFTIDTAAVTVATGSWTLVDTTVKAFTGNFSIAGAGWTETANIWKKTVGPATWIFNEANGVLTRGSFGVITSFTAPNSSSQINNSALTIKLLVPVGTNLATLAPTFTLSGGTCNQTSGAAPSPTFAAQNPVTYTVTDTASDPDTVNSYTVTVVETSMVLSGLTVWLKADDVNPSDPAQVDGLGSVVQWKDSSGQGNNAANAATGDRPTYVAVAANSLPAIRFAQDNDDNGDRLFLGDLSAKFPTGATMFAVVTPSNDGRYNVFDNRTNDSRWMANTWTEAVPGAFRNDRANMGPFNLWPQSGSHIIAMQSGTSDPYTYTIDGNPTQSAAAQYNNGAGQNWVIANRPNGGQALNGDISEFILFNRVLTAEENMAMGGYLTAKYGLNTNYPLPGQIRTFGIAGSDGVINQGAKTISLSVPFGTNLATLAPTFTLSGGTCDQTSESPPSPTFAVANPATYTVTDTATNPDTVNAYTVTVTVQPPPPATDNFANAIALAPAAAGTRTGSGTVSATTEVDEPNSGGVTRSVWFKWTSPSDGDFTINTTGSTNPGDGEWDAVIGIYTGTALANLASLPGTPQDTGLEEVITKAVTAGTTYFIQLVGFENQEAENILLTWSFTGSGGDFQTWADGFGLVGGAADDDDRDGKSNFDEYAFGLNPTSGSSVDPISQQLDKGTGIFKYTRRATPATTGLTYTYEWSTSLTGTWNTFTPVTSPPASDDATPVETITIQVPAAQLAQPALFVRVRALQ